MNDAIDIVDLGDAKVETKQIQNGQQPDNQYGVGKQVLG